MADPNLKLRIHSQLQSIKSGLFKKIPKDFGGQEDNVVFGLGNQVLGGAGSFTLQVNATRDMILRDLVVQTTGNADVQITSITAGGVALLQGGPVPATTFAANNLNRPDFSFPVAGGTPIVISGSVSAASTVGGAFAID